jgi:general stress protein 26
MPEVSSFEELQEEFDGVIQKVIWPAMTTADRKGRPRARIVHPIWEGSTGWVVTGRSSFKSKHLDKTPYVSCAYVDAAGLSPVANQAYAECATEWVDDVAEKKRVWELFKSYPEPYGYDPATFFPGGAEDPELGILKLTPWRVEVFSLAGMMQGQAKVWKNEG